MKIHEVCEALQPVHFAAVRTKYAMKGKTEMQKKEKKTKDPLNGYVGAKKF